MNSPDGRSDQQVGVLAGFAAYAVWGLFPLYFHSLAPAGPIEVLAHRIVWSFVLLAIIGAFRRDWGWVHDLRADPKRAATIVVAGLLLSVNWLVYVWAVDHNHVIDASLGYFINPLVTVGLGVVVLGEHVRRMQIAALALGGAAVVVLVVAYGEVPWVALVLAGSFAGYSLLKKQVGLDSIASLTAETALLFPVAAIGLTWAFADGRTALGHHSAFLDAKLVGLGVVTAVPLLLFGVATTRIPLVTIGLLQYVTPSAQLLLGWLHFGEPMPPARIAGFVLVWAALVVLAADQVIASRRGTTTAARSRRETAPTR